MTSLGIELINAYVGRAYIGVRELFEVRGLDTTRFSNLMMREKSVNLPCEDPVTNAVNAARPILQALSAGARDDIEAVIVGTESGLDLGKPISTYIHEYLGLGRRCRSFEVKHACYGGTAALNTGMGLLSLSANPNASALVVATDAASAAARNTYWEPSQGAGAVAMLVSRRPSVFEIDAGAQGFYSHQVMDTCRPRADLEAGDSDLSLLSYLHCLEESYRHYCERVAGADIHETFDYLVLHTPFAGMVRGAHRTLLRKQKAWSNAAIDEDFEQRVAASLHYCTRVGNVYSAALYMALCSLLDHAPVDGPKRVGMFSYGSGCASEFYSGVIQPTSRERVRGQHIADSIGRRRQLCIEEYERVSELALPWKRSIEARTVDVSEYADLYDACFAGSGLLRLDRIEAYERVYRWS
jgi:polyketide biosynthesis 3-hydroxy-3-methylglutaryl-CoA synthase-like enzyme PksG